MLDITPVRTPELIAEEINAIQTDTINEVGNIMLKASVDIGRRLCEVKGMIPVGRWGEWLRENVRFSERTAQNMMQIYGEYGDGIPRGLARASITNALQLIGLPEDMKTELIEDGSAESLSTRQLKERIRELTEERDQQQVTIDSLMESQQRAEDEADRARADAEAARAELEGQAAQAVHMEQIREESRAMEAQARRMVEQANERAARSQDEADALRDELTRLKSRPVEVVEVVPETVARELAELRSTAQKGRSENMILFQSAYGRLIDQIQECMDLIEEVRRFEGEGSAMRLEAQIRNLGRTIGGAA